MLFKAIAPKSAATSLALARALRKQNRELAQRLDGARSGNQRDVHRARVASRRLREVLAVLMLADVAGSRRLRRRVRRLTRKLGALRELDVMLDELRRANRRHAWSRDLVVPCRADLSGRRRRRRAHLTKALDKLDATAMVKSAEQLARTLRRSTSNEPWRSALTQRVAGRAADVATAIDLCGIDYDPPRLHHLRVAVKKLRYALELGRQTASRKALLDQLSELQKQLGHWHDLHVLANEIVRHSGGAQEGPDSPTPAAAAVADLDRECRRLHAEILPTLPGIALKAAALRADAARHATASASELRTSHGSRSADRRA